jgi:hypothetical protein
MTPFVDVLLRELCTDLPLMEESLRQDDFQNAARARCRELLELAPFYDKTSLTDAIESLRSRYGW